MKLDLLLDIQRKVLGGYINAEEFSVNGSGEEILATKLSEMMFDNPLHKIVVRACNKLIEEDKVPTDYTVLDFLQAYNIPRDASEEAEYLHLMTEHSITPRSFDQYLGMMLKHKAGN